MLKDCSFFSRGTKMFSSNEQKSAKPCFSFYLLVVSINSVLLFLFSRRSFLCIVFSAALLFEVKIGHWIKPRGFLKKKKEMRLHSVLKVYVPLNIHKYAHISSYRVMPRDWNCTLNVLTCIIDVHVYIRCLQECFTTTYPTCTFQDV